MKKLFAKVTAAISAAAMLAVPAINAFQANAAKKGVTDVLEGRKYYREVWHEELKNGHTVISHKTILVGDVNGDNKINLADASAIKQYLQNPTNYPLIIKKGNISDASKYYAADVDGNGYVEKYDATLIQYFDSGLVNHFKGSQYYFNILGSLNPNGTYRVYVKEDKIYSAVLVGDVNGDGKVTSVDASAIKQANSALEGFLIFGSDYIRAGRAADVNCDGYIDETDIHLIKELDAGVRINFDQFA